MCYMSDGMNMTAQLTGLMRTFGRVAGGGSIFQMVFSNDTNTDGYIAMSPDYPGVVVPINMRDCPSGKIVAMRDSFLCSTVGIGEAMCQIGAGFNPASSVGGFCCSGVDFIVQTVSHGEWCFLMGMGTVITKVSVRVLGRGNLKKAFFCLFLTAVPFSLCTDSCIWRKDDCRHG
jgi:uncharacterized protein (AIM24 family)